MATAVSPDAIHEHVKTKIGDHETKKLHYAAPEYAITGVQTSADIYAFGICALEVHVVASNIIVMISLLSRC